MNDTRRLKLMRGIFGLYGALHEPIESSAADMRQYLATFAAQAGSLDGWLGRSATSALLRDMMLVKMAVERMASSNESTLHDFGDDGRVTFNPAASNPELYGEALEAIDRVVGVIMGRVTFVGSPAERAALPVEIGNAAKIADVSNDSILAWMRKAHIEPQPVPGKKNGAKQAPLAVIIDACEKAGTKASMAAARLLRGQAQK
jgi:hypothetical protein